MRLKRDVWRIDERSNNRTNGNGAPTAAAVAASANGCGRADEPKPEEKHLQPDQNHNNQLAVPFVRPRLSTAAIKERLLRFCQRATASYKVSWTIKKNKKKYDKYVTKRNRKHTA